MPLKIQVWEHSSSICWNEEDEQIARAKENDLSGRDIDRTCWISRKKFIIRSWLYRLESEKDFMRFGDDLDIEYKWNQGSIWECSGRMYKVRK